MPQEPGASPDALELCNFETLLPLKVRPQPRRPERNLKRRLDIDGRPILGSRLELPLRHGFGSEPVKALVSSAENSYVANAAIRMNHRVQDNCAVDVFPHELHRVRGIDLARRHWLRKIILRRIRV